MSSSMDCGLTPRGRKTRTHERQGCLGRSASPASPSPSFCKDRHFSFSNLNNLVKRSRDPAPALPFPRKGMQSPTKKIQKVRPKDLPFSMHTQNFFLTASYAPIAPSDLHLHWLQLPVSASKGESNHPWALASAGAGVRFSRWGKLSSGMTRNP